MAGLLICCVCAFLSIVPICLGVPLDDFYPFGDDSEFDVKEDSSSSITLTYSISISLADCSNVGKLNISAGGTVNFFSGSADAQISLKPLRVSLADIDSHTVYHLIRGEFPQALEEKLFAPFKESFRNHSRFSPVSYTTVTWMLEQSYGSSTDLTLINTFQVFFASNGSTSMVVYLYADNQLQWGNSSRNEFASMGINVCSSSWNHPASSTSSLPNQLVTGSNVNVPGMWMFLISNSKLIVPVPCRSGCSFVTGTCHVPDTCSCFNGWEGENCTKPSCPDGCVNGACNSPFTCTCDEGWLTADCSVAACQNSCRNGMCNVPYVCSCNDGWDGENCATPICSNPCVNGTCVGPNDCQCEDGYVGELCDVPVCLGGSDCGGYCMVPGECICNVGYTGVLCNELIPTESPQSTESTLSTGDKGGGGDDESSGLSGSEIGGIIGGILGFVVIVIALVFFIFCVLCCFYF